jgi:hypothetical protein
MKLKRPRDAPTAVYFFMQACHLESAIDHSSRHNLFLPRGVYKGRPATIDAQAVAKLKAQGLGATEIAKRLRIARASVYRVAGAAPAVA